MKDIPELKQEMNFLGKISSWLIDKYRVVYLLIGLIFITGIISYNDMPKESFPEMELNIMNVMTAYPNASVSEVEALVTVPVENALKGIDGLESVKSKSQANTSIVTLTFETGTDMNQAVLNVQSAVSGIRFTDGVQEPIVNEINVGEMPFMNLTLTGDYPLHQINQYAEELQAEFSTIDGVKEVEIIGEQTREIKVIVDETLMDQYGVTVSNIQNALSSSNIQIALGSAELHETKFAVRMDESLNNITELEKLIVKNGSNGTVYLSDVASIEDSFKTQTSGAYTFSKEFSESPEITPVINMSIYKENGSDIIGISSEVNEIISSWKGFKYPEDLSVIVTSDQSVQVENTINTVLMSAIGGLLVVVAVLFVFIGINEALIVGLVIPTSLLIAVTVMNMYGITINNFSLIAFIIALGLLVDNAIVIMENIDRLRDKGLDRITASKVGANQVAPAVLAATVTTLGAFVPLALSGEGLMEVMSVMPLTLIIAIAASFVVSITITPNLASRMLSKHKKKEQKHNLFRDVLSIVFVFVLTFIAFLDDWVITQYTFVFSLLFTGLVVIKILLRKKSKNTVEGEHSKYVEAYGNWLKKTITRKRNRMIIGLISVAVFVSAVLTLPLGILEVELMPEEDPSSATISIIAPEGYLLEDSFKIANTISDQIYGIEDVESFDVSVGGQKPNSASIKVNFVDEEFRTKSSTIVVEEIREICKHIPGAKITVSSTSQMSALTSGDAISVSIQGDDVRLLNNVANQYLNILDDIEGVVDSKISTEDGVKELTIDVDNNRAAYYGLSPNMVASELRKKLGSTKVGTYKESNDNYDISLYYDETIIRSVDDFSNIKFTSPSGVLVPFDEIASLNYSEGMSVIQHKEGENVVTVSASVANGYNATAIGQEFNSKVKAVKLPAGVSKSTGGAFNDMMEEFSDMAISFVIAVMIVFVALVVQFNSFKQPFIILMSVPLALIGVIFGLILTGNNLGIFAVMGVVSLVGIAVNDAIVLIDFANYVRSEGKSVSESIIEAVKVRFLPVFATSLTTMGGVLPLALYNETFSQLGYAIVFGLFASTVLTLLIIPLLYYAMESKAERRKLKKQIEESEVILNG